LKLRGEASTWAIPLKGNIYTAFSLLLDGQIKGA